MSTTSASARTRQYSREQVLAFTCLLAFLVAASLLATAARAAHAAPAAGGTLTVNSSADNVISDTVLTLREALLIARGGTGGDGVTTGLGRPLSVAERAQTVGCSFSGTNNITGGCGANQPDTIQFANLLFANIITLASSLPPIADSQPTTLDGSGTLNLYVNAGAIPVAHDALLISSDNNTVENLRIANSPRFNLYVSGASNKVQTLSSLSAGSHGIFLLGNSNTVLSTTVASNGSNGIDISGAYNILMGNTVISNTDAGLSLHGAANHNFIGCGASCFTAVSGNHISSNFGYGIELTGTLVTLNYIEGNSIGTSGPNLSDGVLLFGAHDNIIGDAGARGNIIGGNHGYGVHLDYFAHDNTIEGNTIGNSLLSNFGGGVLMEGGAQHNTLGTAGAGLGNLIAHNGYVGVVLSGIDTGYNVIDNNVITGTISANIWIEKSAHDNLIGSDSNSRNIIGQSNGDGVHIETGAYSNTILSNYIGVDAQFHNLANAHNGVLILNAFGNHVGSNVTNAYFNYIEDNGDGVLISGISSYGNHIASNFIDYNSGNGVVLTNGAHGNTLGWPQNGFYSTHNQGNGILVQGAHDNTLTNLIVNNNGKNGVELTDANTDSNQLSFVTLFANLLDGINERNGAQDNSWTQLQSLGNTGLGIDKNAPSDITNVPTAPLPVITSASLAGLTLTVSGTATPGLADPSVSVELYQVSGSSVNASGYGEGNQYIGSAVVDSGGHWTLKVQASAVGCYTAFQTIHSLGNFTNTSSEFGPNSCRLFLPIIRR